MSELPTGTPGLERDAPSAADVARVEDLLRGLSAAVRSYRLYAGNGPMLERFVDALRQKLAAVWADLPLVRLEIGEQWMKWEGVRVFPTGDSGADLAFLFYKDGIREVVMLPGLEAEIEPLLRVLGSAPQIREDEDDLITLLWQQSFTAFRYEYVEALAEGVESIAVAGGQPAPIDAAAVRSAAASPPTPAAPAGLTPEDFQDTLYFLDESELRRLREEVQREAERDLWTDVLGALFDRLEDGSAERQIRIVRVLAELLPSALGAGEFDRAAWILRELAQLAARPELFRPEALREVRHVFVQLANPETVAELIKTLEANPEALHRDSLTELLGYFPPESLAPLTRAVEVVNRPDVRRALEAAIQRLAGSNRDEVVRLLADPDPGVAAGAARKVGQLGIGAAVPDLLRLLKHPEESVRCAAVDALVELRAAVAGSSLVALLDDPERDVRVGAARALGALQYTAARTPLEAAIGSKRLRAADRSEKIAFFEAFGQLAGAEGVALLDRALNGRSWLGRGESPEVRACAALALARVRHPAARAALSAAANDSDPVVRSAVQRALREASA